jgi:hypothetical protein
VQRCPLRGDAVGVEARRHRRCPAEDIQHQHAGFIQRRQRALEIALQRRALMKMETAEIEHREQLRALRDRRQRCEHIAAAEVDPPAPLTEQALRPRFGVGQRGGVDVHGNGTAAAVRGDPGNRIRRSAGEVLAQHQRRLATHATIDLGEDRRLRLRVLRRPSIQIERFSRREKISWSLICGPVVFRTEEVHPADWRGFGSNLASHPGHSPQITGAIQ